MSAAELRQAAETLRMKVAATRPGPWEAYPDGLVWDVANRPGDPISGSTEPDDADYIATMHPGVGLALAEALDHYSRHWWDYNSPHLLDVARLINGGPA